MFTFDNFCETEVFKAWNILSVLKKQTIWWESWQIFVWLHLSLVMENNDNSFANRKSVEALAEKAINKIQFSLWL